MRKRFSLLETVLAAAVLLALGGGWWLRLDNAYHRRGRTEWQNATRIEKEFVAYADSHGGKFPNAWRDLPPDTLSPELRHFHDPRTGQELDWIYYGGFVHAEDYRQPEARHIILVSPRPGQSQQYVAVYADCHTAFTEQEFLRQQLDAQSSDSSWLPRKALR